MHVLRWYIYFNYTIEQFLVLDTSSLTDQEGEIIIITTSCKIGQSGINIIAYYVTI